MSLTRRATTLLEAMISVAIFTTVMGVVFNTMISGAAAKTAVETQDGVSDSNARTLQSIAGLLRYADVNRIYLDGQAWTSTVAGSDYYSFKICTGFEFTNNGSAASLDRVVSYGQGVILRFARNADQTGTLYSTTIAIDPVTGVPGAAIEAERVLARGLAWRYTPAGASAELPGFQILQLDPTQTSVVGNQIGIRVASITATTAGVQTYRDVYSTVYLRSSMYTGVGLLEPDITSPVTATGNTGSAFIYDIAATNDPTHFAAANLPSTLTVDPYTGRISGTPTATEIDREITLSASNDVGTDTQILTLTVKGPLPQIISPRVINAEVNQAVAYQTVATNSPTRYAATNLPAGLVIQPYTGLISGSVSSLLTNWPVTLTASNANGSVSIQLLVGVTSQPLPKPEVSGGSVVAASGAAVLYQITASNSPTGYGASGLPAGLACNTATGIISGVTAALGTYNVALSASNAAGTGAGNLYLTVQEPACVITSPATATATVGASFTYQITATNSPTSFAASSLPAWLTINGSGMLAGTPTESGADSIYLTASNSVGSGTAVLALTVAPPAPPGIGLPSPLSATAGVLYEFTPSVTPAVPTSWRISGLPSGMVLANSSTGGVTGKASIVGSFILTFTATNAGGTSTVQTILNVAANPNLPVVTLGANTANGARKLQVLGTVAAATGRTLDLASFNLSASQALTIYRGWVPAEASGSKTSLGAGQFLLTSSDVGGSVAISAQISDTTGNIGAATQTY